MYEEIDVGLLRTINSYERWKGDLKAISDNVQGWPEQLSDACSKLRGTADAG